MKTNNNIRKNGDDGAVYGAGMYLTMVIGFRHRYERTIIGRCAGDSFGNLCPDRFRGSLAAGNRFPRWQFPGRISAQLRASHLSD